MEFLKGKKRFVEPCPMTEESSYMRMRILVLTLALLASGMQTVHAQIRGVTESPETDDQGQTWIIFKTRRPFIRGSKIEDEWKSRSPAGATISECQWHRENLINRIGKCRYKNIIDQLPTLLPMPR